MMYAIQTPKAMTEQQGWLPIETLPADDRRMFIAIAINVRPSPSSAPYTSDPYCVWREPDGHLARWPHSFGPTHWSPLPAITHLKTEPTTQEMAPTPPTIPAARATKQELDHAISELVTDFAARTGLRVVSIDMDDFPSFGGGRSYEVTTVVEL